MKKVIGIMVAALSFAALNAQVIYVVDVQEVHKNYYKAKTAEANLTSTAERSKEEIARMDEKIQAVAKELEAIKEKLNNPALSAEAKTKIINEEGAPKENELRRMASERDNWLRQTQTKLNQNAQSILAAHRKEILEAAKKIGEQKKADFVLDKAVVHFSKPASDITEEVIALLNANNK